MNSHPTRILGAPRAVPEADNSGSDSALRAAPSREMLPGDEIAGYLVVQLIGEGGMGRVLEVRHPSLQKSFALKLMSESLEQNSNAVDRFRMETLALGKLDHPNIVQAIDAGQWNGRPFLVTQLLKGADLTSHIEVSGPIDFDRARKYAIQICQGLQAAHEVGLFHRDVKPSNLFLETNGNIKLLDFGLVRSMANVSCTQTGCVMGSVDYLSPEQAIDPRKADARSDIYSFGCTLIYLLSGQPPFSDQDFPSMTAKLMAHASEQPKWLRQQIKINHHPLVKLIERSVAKDPNQRPQSMAEVLESLNAISITNLPENSSLFPAKKATAFVWKIPSMAAFVLLIAFVVLFNTLNVDQSKNAISSNGPVIESDRGPNQHDQSHRLDRSQPEAFADDRPQPAPEPVQSETSSQSPAKETLNVNKTQSARGAVLPSRLNFDSQSPLSGKTKSLGSFHE